MTGEAGQRRAGQPSIARWVPRLAATLLVVVSSCSNALVFGTSQLAGIELNGTEGGQQSAKVALDRVEAIAMPGCKESAPWYSSEPCKEVLPKAYAALSVSDIQTGALLLPGLTNSKITQVFATGRAAREALAPESTANTFLALEGATLIYAKDHRDLRARIDGWLSDADNNAEFKAWAGSRSQRPSVWVEKATREELQRAIDHFSIP